MRARLGSVKFFLNNVQNKVWFLLRGSGGGGEECFGDEIDTAFDHGFFGGPGEVVAAVVVDEDAGGAVHVGPDGEGIGGGVGGGREESGLLADSDDADEVLEGLAAEEVGFGGFGEIIGGDVAEDEAVLVGVLDAELDVAADAGGEGGVGGEGLLFDLVEAIDEDFEGFDADGIDDFCFVFEVEVDGGGGVFDTVGDGAHGDAIEAVVEEEFGGHLENFLTESVFFAGAAFGGSHYPQVFAECRRIVKRWSGDPGPVTGGLLY